MSQSFLDGRVVLHPGDCLDVVRTLPPASIDAVVTDPPYALVSITKRFGQAGAAACKVPEGGSGAYARASAGFMGKAWDTGEVAFASAFWAEVLRVLKPGGHVAAFGGTRSYHRLACAIEDAGFEIRDQLAWTYGTGFPKSKDAGEGRGTALKPAWEPICLARKPLIGTVAANVAAHGTGGLNIDGCRVGTNGEDRAARYAGRPAGSGGSLTHAGRITEAWKAPEGRWPANLVHDGSDEVVAAFPNEAGGGFGKRGTGGQNGILSPIGGTMQVVGFGDSGSAARFFYSAKADADDRIGSKHPTVKPVDLMCWLVRLVTPAGGTVLDPFAGTGTTGEAAFREGMRAVLIERETEYQADIARRLDLACAGPGERRAAIAQARPRPSKPAPLFADL